MRGRQVRFDSFGGGINLEAAPFDVAANECRDARNVQSTRNGTLRKRDGSTQFLDTAHIYESIFAAGKEDVLIVDNQSASYAITPGGVVTTIRTATSDPGPHEWIKAPAIGGQGPFYGNLGSTPRQWTGTGVTADWTATVVDATHTKVPQSPYLLYHGNRVWMAGRSTAPDAPGTPADPHALYFSNIGDPRDWPLANIVRFDPNDGEEISGIGIAGQYILVFKPSKIWLVTDLNNGANRPVSRNIGCISHRSIAETPIGTIFLSHDGIYVANQNNTQLLSNNEKISGPISPLLAGLSPFANRAASAVYFDNHYYLAVTQGAARILLDYDLVTRAWWIHTLSMADMTIWQPTNGAPALYGAPYADSRIVRLFVPDTPTDVGVAFSSYWDGPFHTFGKPALRKRCREMQVNGTGVASISLAKDYAATSTLAGSGFSGSATVKDARVFSPGVARAWSTSFSNSTADDFEIMSYTMSMQERTD